jgi:hypothetical protein
MTRVLSASLLAAAFATGAAAHHSYAMFDGTQVQSVTGTVARLEWTNPHVFIWLYVPNRDAANGYDLYAFENGSTNVLLRRGWSKDALPAGQKVALEYWPLRDGRKGGHLKSVKLEDGRVLQGAGGPRGVDGVDSPVGGVPKAAP